MERLDSLSGSVTLTSAGTDQSLTAKGMPAGRAVDKFYLKLILVLGRGGAALAHLPQAVSEILNRLVISHGRINWNVAGRVIHLADMLQRLSANSMVPELTAVATNLTMYIPIDPSPVGPPFRKANTFRTEELQNCVFDLSLRNPFDTLNDVVTLDANVELWATYRKPDPEQKPWVSMFRQQDTFQGNSIVINDMVPALAIGLGESPTNFDKATIDATGMRIARNADMLDLDARDYYYQMIQANQAGDIVQGGNQFLRDVPRANAPAENYHKIYDVRNDPDAALPITATYVSIPAQFGYFVKGSGV